MLAQRFGMVVAPCEYAAMDARVERLHPAVHHFGEAGMGRDLGDVDAGIRQGAEGAAGREQFHAMRAQCAGKGDQPGLVGDGQQGAADEYPISHF